MPDDSNATSPAELSRLQTLSWAMGRPYHERTLNECCPDFSCCMPELFMRDAAARWRVYRDEHGLAAGDAPSEPHWSDTPPEPETPNA